MLIIILNNESRHKLFFDNQVGFQREIPCRYTNGYSYTVAVGLSMFLGWLGVDRYIVIRYDPLVF